MTPRWMAVGALAAALFTGCRTAPAPWSSAPPTAPDPDRWDRAACNLGVYPLQVDSRALAWARLDDLRARQTGSPSPFAAARLLSERDAFDARCAAWRATNASNALHGATAQTD